MNLSQRDLAVRHIKCSFKLREPLAQHTTFRIGGPAEIFAEPSNVNQLLDLLRLIRAENLPHFYLGLGSNILVSDDGFDGVVIKARGDLCRIGVVGGQLFSGPGARLLDLTCFAARLHLSGMEPLCGIPGSVGGGLWMNAGAYGGEICQTVVEVDVVEEDITRKTLLNNEIGFAYRSAPALRNVVILESRYRLASGETKQIYGEMRRVWKLRRLKQPLAFPSAGSIFKRPPGDYAGRLIEAVKGKGTRIGGAMVSEKHAGIFVNVGGATADDVTSLVREIRRRVNGQFGIMLETEVKPVGFTKDPFLITA
jgi:UDP-N-acetylmuramate dehydrogenase